MIGFQSFELATGIQRDRVALFAQKPKCEPSTSPYIISMTWAKTLHAGALRAARRYFSLTACQSVPCVAGSQNPSRMSAHAIRKASSCQSATSIAW